VSSSRQDHHVLYELRPRDSAVLENLQTLIKSRKSLPLSSSSRTYSELVALFNEPNDWEPYTFRRPVCRI
jgi:hypothetical protein